MFPHPYDDVDAKEGLSHESRLEYYALFITYLTAHHITPVFTSERVMKMPLSQLVINYKIVKNNARLLEEQRNDHSKV